MAQKKVYKATSDYFHPYLDLVETNNLLDELETSKKLTQDTFDLITREKENYAYQPNKWTVKEVIRHIIGTERVLAYRAFRFSRLDNTELAGFDENNYINNAKNIELSLPDLWDEYLAVRSSTISLFKPMSDEMLDYKGTANGVDFTARALGFIIAGHNVHHCNFIKTKYLDEA